MLNLYSRPAQSRGIVPLIALAMGAGAVRAGIGAISGNQRKQRNKGYVNAAYKTAKQRLDVDQSSARQDIAESLNARGLAQGGSGVNASPIATAMIGSTREQQLNPMMAKMLGKDSVTVENDDKKMTPLGPGATTIGGQQVQNANVEMGLESQDLDQQRDRAKKEGNAQYFDDLLNAGVSGIQTGMSVYSAGKDIQAGRAANAERSKIHMSMLSGAAYGGVNPVDPLGEPSSAWSTHPRLAEPGQENGSFNVFG